MEKLILFLAGVFLLGLGCTKKDSVEPNDQAQIQADETILTSIQEDYAFARMYNDSLVYCSDPANGHYGYRYDYDHAYHFYDSMFDYHHNQYSGKYHFTGYCDSLYDYMLQHPGMMGPMHQGNGNQMMRNFNWHQHQGYNSDGSDLEGSCLNMMGQLRLQHQQYHP